VTNAHSPVPVLGPGSVVILAGPDVRYVVTGLETHGDRAALLLRTEDGRPWPDDRARENRP
jgi:hypothetical protein